MKKVMLTIALLGSALVGLHAQTTYEYATVVYEAKGFGGAKILVSEEGKFEQTNVSIKEGVIADNLTPVLETVNKMAKEGWEVYNNNVIAAGSVYIYYHLRRKKE